jgi:hypothetical protein
MKLYAVKLADGSWWTWSGGMPHLHTTVAAAKKDMKTFRAHFSGTRYIMPPNFGSARVVPVRIVEDTDAR